MKLIVRVYGGTLVLGALTMMSDSEDFTVDFRCHRAGTITHATVMAESGVERGIETDIGRKVQPLDLVSVRVTR